MRLRTRPPLLTYLLTVTYTHRPSHNKPAVNAVNANDTADPNTAEPADTSVKGVGHPKPPAKKTVSPGPKLPPFFLGSVFKTLENT